MTQRQTQLCIQIALNALKNSLIADEESLDLIPVLNSELNKIEDKKSNEQWDIFVAHMERIDYSMESLKHSIESLKIRVNTIEALRNHK
jgi:hypothetical protein